MRIGGYDLQLPNKPLGYIYLYAIRVSDTLTYRVATGVSGGDGAYQLLVVLIAIAH